jgi:cyclophilin family peptidyl-prolyl cis-trans isomerase
MGTACALALALIAGPAGAETDSTAAAPGAASTEAAMTAAKLAAAATTPAGAKPAAAAARAAGKATMTGGAQVVVLETVQGTIVIRLRDDAAPKTCANFRKLVKNGYYDGTYFHRVIPNFMIQGGDPNTKNADPSDDGQGGPPYTIPAEIKLKHVRGAVATARLGDDANPKRDSSGSQFFIDLKDLPSLDAGGYTVFGEVISGMETADKIVALANDPSTLRSAMGPNPQKKALIKHAELQPLAKWEKPKAASGS